jgi:hypothetical protein
MALGTIALQIATAVFVVLWIKKSPHIEKVYKHFPAIVLVLFVSSAIGSFIYEYGFGYEPCLLCWYQRIAIFGIAILSFTGDIRANKTLQKQVLIFSTLGILVALLHNYTDIVPNTMDICGAGPSCLKRYIHEFGYITIPMMSLTTLVSGFVLALFSTNYRPTANLE